MDSRIKAFCEYLNHSHSPYHAQANLARELDRQGYTRLREGEEWALQPGGNYYVCRGNAALIGFRVPEKTPRGFLLSAAHTDRPSFKLKENGEKTGPYTTLCVERYGGSLMAPWLDRPLSLAGRVLVETEAGAACRLLDIDRDLLLIPNVAIHMNRKANEGYAWNPAVDLLPLMGGADAKGRLNALLEEAAGGKILGHDLYLYTREKARVWGMEEEFLSAPALDDLECAWGCTRGFLASEDSDVIPVLEEVGSNSVQGAASTLLADTLERICAALDLAKGELLSRSFLVSADNAHAVHPNHPEYADPGNAPVLNGGPVLKFNAAQRYTTDGFSAAVFRRVCGKAGVKVQTYCNRADIAGGSTLGHISLTQVSIPTADIGLAQLAMHSCYETAGVRDALALEKAMTAFYGIPASELAVD